MPASQDETAVAHQRRPLIFQRVTRRARRLATVSNARVVTACGTTPTSTTSAAGAHSQDKGARSSSRLRCLLGHHAAATRWLGNGAGERRRRIPARLLARKSEMIVSETPLTA